MVDRSENRGLSRYGAPAVGQKVAQFPLSRVVLLCLAENLEWHLVPLLVWLPAPLLVWLPQ